MTRLVAFCAGTLVAGPGFGLAAVLATRMFRRRVGVRPARVDVLGEASLLLVLVGSGMPLIPALGRVGASDPDVAVVVRRAGRLGAAAALASASGPLAPLLRRLADAALSGAPPEPAIRGFIESERRRLHTRAVERARRLPVRLMIPMTLLLLPGFVLTVYGPAFIGMVTDLVGPLVP